MILIQMCIISSITSELSFESQQLNIIKASVQIRPITPITMSL